MRLSTPPAAPRPRRDVAAGTASGEHRPSRGRRAAGLSILGTLVSVLMAFTAYPAAADATPGARPSSPGTVSSASPTVGPALSPAVSSAAVLCAKVATKAGFSFNRTVGTALGQEPQIIVAISVAMAESSCNPNATNINTNGSEDRGLWQINNAAWPNVSNACAFQVQCNADAAWNISNHGTNWGPWSTFNSGAWESYVSYAQGAITSGFTVQLQDQGAGTCLDADASNIGNGGKIFQWSCNSSDSFQQWAVVDSVGHLPVLRNVGAGTCLDWDGSAIGNAKPIFQWACNSGDGSQQLWFNGTGKLNTNGAADAGIQNNHDGTCVDADGSSIGNGKAIFQWTCNGSDSFQQWN